MKLSRKLSHVTDPCAVKNLGAWGGDLGNLFIFFVKLMKDVEKFFRGHSELFEAFFILAKVSCEL